MTTGTLQKISDKYAGHSPNGIMSMALIEWKETKLSDGEKPSVRNLNDALVESDVDNHLICQVCMIYCAISRLSEFVGVSRSYRGEPPTFGRKTVIQ